MDFEIYSSTISATWEMSLKDDIIIITIIIIIIIIVIRGTHTVQCDKAALQPCYIHSNFLGLTLIVKCAQIIEL